MKNRKIWFVVVLTVVVILFLLTSLAFFVPSLERVRHFIDLAALLISILALFFAAKQFTDAEQEMQSLQKVSAKVTEQVNALEVVSRELAAQSTTLKIVNEGLSTHSNLLGEFKQELSTRFVAGFPQNLIALAEFVDKVPGTLDIMADFVGYGSFSKRKEFASYVAELKKRAESFEIRFLVYDEELARKALKEQLPENRIWENENRKLLEEFYHTHRELIRDCCKQNYESFDELKKIISYEEIIELLLQEELGIQKDLRQIEKIKMRTIGKPTPAFVVHAWISTDRVLFSFNVTNAQLRNAQLRELTFNTEDSRLIKIFSALFDNLWEASALSADAARAR